MLGWTAGWPVVAAVAFMTGCHTYTPVESPVPGSVVRVSVPVTSAVADPNAPPRTASVEGVVLSASDTIALVVRSARQADLFRQIVSFDTLQLDVSALAGMDVREFSAGRSIALGVALAGGGTVLALAALSIEQGGNPNDDGSGPVTSVVLNRAVSALLRIIGR